MDPRLQMFLYDHGYMNESSKFLGMSFILFTAMPVNALRAMGLSDGFIHYHKILTDRLANNLHRVIRARSGERLLQTNQHVEHHAGGADVRVRSRSPDYAYHSPAVFEEPIYATYQPKLGEKRCGRSVKVKYVRARRRTRRRRSVGPRGLLFRSDFGTEASRMMSAGPCEGRIRSSVYEY